MIKRIKSQLVGIKEELPLIEYISWWVLRLAMVTTYIVFMCTDKALYQCNLILINTVATFAIPLLRIVSPKKLFTSKITFRTQTYIDIFVFMGSFLGHGFEFLGKIHEYDKFMHVVAGGVVVFIGAEVLKAFKGNEKITAGIKTFCGVGFSFIIIVAWEIMEFIADWVITDSTNQGYNITPDSTMFFVKIFGMPKNPGQAPLYDTNVDMIYAVIGCAVCAAILFAVLKRKEAKLPDVAEKLEEASEVTAS